MFDGPPSDGSLEPGGGYAYLHEFEQWRRAGERLEGLLNDWRNGTITLKRLRRELGSAWKSVDFPHRYAPEALELFRAAGYVTDSRHRRPRERLKIFRGTTHGPKTGVPLGMSWTLDEGYAAHLAHGYLGNPVSDGGEPTVFAGEISGRRILGLFTDREESEVVCDPADVKVLATYRWANSRCRYCEKLRRAGRTGENLL